MAATWLPEGTTVVWGNDLWRVVCVPNGHKFEPTDRCLGGDLQRDDIVPQPGSCEEVSIHSRSGGWAKGYYVWRKLGLNKGDPNLGEVCP